MNIYDVTALVISLAMVVVLGILIGCTPNDQSDLSYLPYTELNFAAAPNIPDARVSQGILSKKSEKSKNSSHKWAARGNRPWKYIIIHHSATQTGSAKEFDKMHRRKGWDEMGYHFVINNGRGGTDGKVEVGSRWRKQKWGAHTKTPNNEHNNFGIGVCLVGNFMNSMPSQKQLAAMRELVEYLMITYDIPPQNVIAHKDAPILKPTECCGKTFHRYVHSNSFRRQLNHYTMAR
ncbi:MAG: N-acetylmuramoyl-L-alanine amidase [Phycisphaerae bacterium]|nr:N-acetylmuramoyl-L-alanine amidase [Phycisphaerae bacterium]